MLLGPPFTVEGTLGTVSGCAVALCCQRCGTLFPLQPEMGAHGLRAPGCALAASRLFTEAAGGDGSFERSERGYRGGQGAAESSDESDASSSDDGSMGSGLAWVFGAPKICEGARIWCRRNRAKVLVLVPSNAKRCRKMLQNGHKTAI